MQDCHAQQGQTGIDVTSDRVSGMIPTHDVVIAHVLAENDRA